VDPLKQTNCAGGFCLESKENALRTRGFCAHTTNL